MASGSNTSNLRTVSLITSETIIKVSSTLDKSVGKKYLVDGNPETCWTSQQGLPQWISLIFPPATLITPTRISLTFQGGFVGKKCAVHYKAHRDPNQVQDDGQKDPWIFLTYIFPEDVNRKQTFDLIASSTSPQASLSSEPATSSEVENPSKQSDASVKATQFKLTFEESTDFFGRITVYDLGLEGLSG